MCLYEGKGVVSHGSRTVLIDVGQRVHNTSNASLGEGNLPYVQRETVCASMQLPPARTIRLDAFGIAQSQGWS